MAELVRLFRWFPGVAILALAVCLSFWGAGILAPPEWATAFERLRAERIAAKDDEACAKLGFLADSLRHADCRAELLGVRVHDRQVNTF